MLKIKEHELKTDPREWDDVAEGRKKFEVRFNDRDYEVGDLLALSKTKFSGEQMRGGAPLEYIGPPLYMYVIHMLHGPVFGLMEGWVIMSIRPRDSGGRLIFEEVEDDESL